MKRPHFMFWLVGFLNVLFTAAPRLAAILPAMGPFCPLGLAYFEPGLSHLAPCRPPFWLILGQCLECLDGPCSPLAPPAAQPWILDPLSGTQRANSWQICCIFLSCFDFPQHRQVLPLAPKPARQMPNLAQEQSTVPENYSRNRENTHAQGWSSESKQPHNKASIFSLCHSSARFLKKPVTRIGPILELCSANLRPVLPKLRPGLWSRS